jgi:hypothetical protein
MTPQDDLLEAVIRGLGFTHCPMCQTRITTANVRVGWNPSAADDAVFPRAWLTCTHNQCGTHLKVVSVTLPGGRFVQSQEEAINALLEAI